jgi:hypothetical protein
MTITSPIEKPAAMTDTSPGGFLVFGILAGGTLGLLSGLAQYNAMFPGPPQFMLAFAMTVAGGVLGAPLLGGVGWLCDRLVQWRKAARLNREPREAVDHIGAVYPRPT